LTGESGFAKDGAHPQTSVPLPPIFPAKNLNIKGLRARFQGFARFQNFKVEVQNLASVYPSIFRIADSRGHSIAFGKTLCSVESDG
jgi:hypothetical protein